MEKLQIDLLYNKLLDFVLRTCCTAARLVVDSLWTLLYSLLYNKSTTNSTSGVRS